MFEEDVIHIVRGHYLCGVYADGQGFFTMVKVFKKNHNRPVSSRFLCKSRARNSISYRLCLLIGSQLIFVNEKKEFQFTMCRCQSSQTALDYFRRVYPDFFCFALCWFFMFPLVFCYETKCFTTQSSIGQISMEQKISIH